MCTSKCVRFLRSRQIALLFFTNLRASFISCSDNKWECQRRMLCEANQRAGEYGVLQGVVMYFLSLAVSLLLENQKVSDSLEAMKIGRRGGDCAQLYQKCPFSL